MPFQTETAARGRFMVFIPSARIEGSAISELRRLFEGQTALPVIGFNLKDVSLIVREVMRFFHALRSGWREVEELRSIYSRVEIEKE
jgi:hypothetical protein